MMNRVVCVTGATSGIGEATAWRFLKDGAKLVLIGRRQERLEALKNAMEEYSPQSEVHIETMSVSDLEAVASLPGRLPEKFANVDVLVNNAGLALGVTGVDKNDMAQLQTQLNTNVLGLAAMCRTFTPSMIARGRGHIINIGSIAGIHAYPNGSLYNASKFAVNGFTQAIRHDLMATPVRVTEIRPGMVQTEFWNVRFGGDGSEEAVAKAQENVMPLQAGDIADQVFYVATRPSHVQIADITVYPTNQCSPRDIARVGESLGAPEAAPLRALQDDSESIIEKRIDSSGTVDTPSSTAGSKKASTSA